MYRPHACSLKTLQNVIPRYCRALSGPKDLEEVAFCDSLGASRALEVVVEFLGVVRRKRRKEDRIKRLEVVDCVRGKDGEEGSIAVAKIL
jgi:hypothetical protein